MSKVNKSVKTSDNFCKYYRGLQGITGGILGSLAWKELEYQFSVRNCEDGFFKFLEPCGHKLYKEGDSWTEKLEFSVDEWKTATREILTQHKSLTSFRESKDVFKGKLYASYYDRPKHLTYYFRNHELANIMSAEYFSTGAVTVTESDYPCKRGIPVSGDFAVNGESRFPEQGNPGFDIKKQKITTKDKIHSSQKVSKSEETLTRSSLPEERNLNKNFKVEDPTSQDQITSKVSDERSKTVMSSQPKQQLGKFLTLDKVPESWIDDANKRFKIKSDRVLSVEGAFLEHYIRNHTPRSLVSWEKLWTEFVKRRTVMVPTDFEPPKIIKQCVTHKYKKRTGIDAKICDIIMEKVGSANFYSYIEHGRFEEIEPNKLKFFVATRMAYEWFDEMVDQILSNLGYKVVAHEITGLKAA